MHPTGGSLRVFRQFAWLEVDSVKIASSRPAHPRVTQTVGRFLLTRNFRVQTYGQANNLKPQDDGIITVGQNTITNLWDWIFSCRMQFLLVDFLHV